MFILSYTSPFCLCKVNTLTSKQRFARCISNVIVLLCTAEIERVQSLTRTLPQTDFKSV